MNDKSKHTGLSTVHRSVRECSEPGCHEKHKAKGFCKRHYVPQNPGGGYGHRKYERFAGIYFFRCNEFVKIGYSIDVRSRLVNARMHSPYELELLGAVRCGHEVEKEIQAKFWHLHHRGEWFRTDNDLLMWIAEQKATNPQPDMVTASFRIDVVHPHLPVKQISNDQQ